MQRLAIPKKKRIYAIAFSPDGRDLAAACGDNVLRIWDAFTGDLKHSYPVQETSSGYAVAFLDDTRLVCREVGLSVKDLVAQTAVQIDPRNLLTPKMARSPDGRHLAEVEKTESTDWERVGLVVYDTGTWAMLPPAEDGINTTEGVAFSPDGRYLATGHIVNVGQKPRSVGYGFGSFPVNDYDYVVRLREFPSCRVVRTIRDWQQGVRFLAFSPDGSTLVGAAGPRLRVWDLANDRELALHKRGTKHFQGLAFTADGRYVATVSNDETVRLWDAHTWQEKTTFTWDIGRLLNIAFAPDGLRAAAGSDKGQIVIWDVE